MEKVDTHVRIKICNISKTAMENSKDQSLAITEAKPDLKSASEQNSRKDKIKIEGRAYKRRNVYKSIIRHMARYIVKNRPILTHVLINNGFNQDEIDTRMTVSL